MRCTRQSPKQARITGIVDTDASTAQVTEVLPMMQRNTSRQPNADGGKHLIPDNN